MSKDSASQDRQDVRPGQAQPHNLDAERSVLGACLLHADVVRDVVALQPFHFFLPKHAAIYRAIRAVHAAHRVADPISVANELQQHGDLEAIGNSNYLFDLLEGVVTAAGVDYHATIIVAKWRARALIDAARETLQRAADGADPDELATLARQRLEAISDAALEATTLTALSLSDLDQMGNRPQLVDGLLHTDTLNAFVGPQKQFKTVVADALCVAVADERQFLGRHVLAPGIACDFALEGAGGKKPRYRAQLGVARFSDTTDRVHKRLFLFTDVPDLTTTVGQDVVLRSLESLQKRTGEQVRLTKWDTLARAMSRAGADENDTKDMNSFVGGLDRIRSRLPHTQVIVHHTGVSGRERGSTVLAGAVDLLALVNKTGPCAARFTVRDARDIEVPNPWAIRFAPVVVGQYENGRPVTAMRIDGVEPVAATEQQEPEASDARRALDDLADRVGMAGFDFKTAKAAAARAKSTTSALLKKMRFEKFTGDDGNERWRRRPR